MTHQLRGCRPDRWNPSFLEPQVQLSCTEEEPRARRQKELTVTQQVGGSAGSRTQGFSHWSSCRTEGVSKRRVFRSLTDPSLPPTSAICRWFCDIGYFSLHLDLFLCKMGTVIVITRRAYLHHGRRQSLPSCMRVPLPHEEVGYLSPS